MTNERPTPELLHKILRYVPETGELYWRERTSDLHAVDSLRRAWNKRYAGKEAMTTKHYKGYLYGCIFNKKLFAHRVIFAMVYGYWPEQVDHINHKKSDNRIENIREVTAAENNRNAPLISTNTSGYNGVRWDKNSGKWIASMDFKGKYKHLGCFGCVTAAAVVRKIADIKCGFHPNHGRKEHV